MPSGYPSLLSSVLAPRRLASVMLAALVAWGAVGASTAFAVDLDGADVRSLEHDLRTWEQCQIIAIVYRVRSCRVPGPPPDAIADVESTLRSLSGLDLLAGGARGRHERVGAITRCLLAASIEVRGILGERAAPVAHRRLARRHSHHPHDPRGDRVARACDGVRLPSRLASHAVLGEGGACAYAMGDHARIRGSGFQSCLWTLASSRLASAGIGPSLPRPNMLVILTDDQRWDALDATHSPLPELGLPAMPAVWSRLAGEGVTFTQAVVTTPVCAPSRGSFFTGLNTHRHRMITNSGSLGVSRFEDGDTWATRLDGAGYHTGFLGKYANGFADIPTSEGGEPYTPPGWDDFRVFDHPQSVPQTRFKMVENGERVSYDTPDAPYATDVLTRQALEFIDASAADDSGEPFALWISTTTPHYPWHAAPRHMGAFDQLEFVLYPSTFEADVSDKPAWIQSRAGFTLRQLLGLYGLRRAQLSMQLSTDEMVAVLLDRLEEKGMGDDTVIVYVSDNGQAWGEHRWNNKGCPWEECLKVPLVIRYPRIVPGPRVEGGLVASVDLAPTLLSLAGVTERDDVDGVDLSEAIRGFAPVPVRDVLFETYSGRALTYAGVRRDGLKYFEYRDGSEVLHDLTADPFELENYADLPEYADLKRDMQTSLHALWPGFDHAMED